MFAGVKAVNVGRNITEQHIYAQPGMTKRPKQLQAVASAARFAMRLINSSTTRIFAIVICAKKRSAAFSRHLFKRLTTHYVGPVTFLHSGRIRATCGGAFVPIAARCVIMMILRRVDRLAHWLAR
jgi:hypothetical protein